jgi:hypothetical protein
MPIRFTVEIDGRDIKITDVEGAKRAGATRFAYEVKAECPQIGNYSIDLQVIHEKSKAEAPVVIGS